MSKMDFKYKLRQEIAKLHQMARAGSYWAEYLSWLAFSTAKFRKFPKNVKRVLVVNYGALGDVFCSIRMVHNLKLNNPEIEFFIAGYDAHFNLVKFFERESGIKILSEKGLGKEKFDLVLLFSAPARLNDRLKNIGFSVGNEYSSILESIDSLRNWFINRKIAPRNWDRHKIRQEIRICKRARLKINEILADFEKKKTKRVDKVLKKSKIKKFVIIHPSGKNFAELMKRGKIPALAWPLKRFSEVADYLVEKGFDVVLTGAKDERFIADSVRFGAKNKKRIFNLAGELDIEELTDLTARAKMLVSVDTSIVHIGEFVGTPVIALFGPTFPEEVAPYGKKNIVLHHPEMCVRDRRKGACYGGKNTGMDSISTEEVKKAIDKLS